MHNTRQAAKSEVLRTAHVKLAITCAHAWEQPCRSSSSSSSLKLCSMIRGSGAQRLKGSHSPLGCCVPETQGRQVVLGKAWATPEAQGTSNTELYGNPCRARVRTCQHHACQVTTHQICAHAQQQSHPLLDSSPPARAHACTQSLTVILSRATCRVSSTF